MGEEPAASVPNAEKSGEDVRASDETPAAAPFTIFTEREKWIVVNMAAFGSLFSPLTANIYFPAVPVMADQFHKSIEQINLTITVYMIFQGVTPMLWGNLADRLGRRPIFIVCIVILTLSCVGLALCPTDAYWLLLFLRCIQAAGSASTVALASGIMGDVVTRAERGKFVGVMSFGPSVGPMLGPIIGGGLTQGLGWRSIFWFLCIASSLCAIFLVLFLPETLRSIVGNGSIRPAKIYRPWIPLLPSKLNEIDQTVALQTRPPRRKLLNPLRILTSLDIFVLLFVMGIQVAVLYGVLASLSTLFSTVYPFLSETEIGLCFLALGGGLSIGAVVCGKFIDMDYARAHARWTSQHTDAEKVDKKPLDDHEFPIEQTRLRLVPFFLAPLGISVIGYGWCLQNSVHIAVPLVLHFIMGASVSGFFNVVTALSIDLFPDQGGSITACNNLVRCALGAIMVAVFDLIANALGLGWTYVLLGCIGMAVYPLIFIIVKRGPNLRKKRGMMMEGH